MNLNFFLADTPLSDVEATRKADHAVYGLERVKLRPGVCVCVCVCVDALYGCNGSWCAALNSTICKERGKEGLGTRLANGIASFSTGQL